MPWDPVLKLFCLNKYLWVSWTVHETHTKNADAHLLSFSMRSKRALRIRLIGGVEKWEDEKLVWGWKSGRLEKIWFSLMCVWLKGWKSVLKLFLLKKVFASLMNSTRDPHKKCIYTSTFLFNAIQTCTKGSFDWRSGKVGGWKISRRMEKWEVRKDLVFPHVCLVEMVEKWEGEKLFSLVGEKKERIKNIVYINWLLYHYYIIYKK